MKGAAGKGSLKREERYEAAAGTGDRIPLFWPLEAQPNKPFTVSRRIRTPSRKYRFLRGCRAGGLSCASRCGLTCRTWGNPYSCSCPSPFYGLLFLRSFRQLPWFVSPDLSIYAQQSGRLPARMIADGVCSTTNLPENRESTCGSFRSCVLSFFHSI